MPFEAEVGELILQVDGDNRPFVQVDVMGLQVIGLLDCGAQTTVLGIGSEKLIRALKLKLQPSSMKLTTAGGTALGVRGSVSLPITFNGQTKIVSAIVAPGLSRRLILGMNFWKSFEIHPTVKTLDEALVEEIEAEPEDEELLTEEQKQQINEVRKEFKAFVEGGPLETTPMITHKIEFTEEYKHADPVRLNPYPWSPEVQKSVNEELDKWIEAGVVERSDSDWAMLIVPVMKKGESEDGEVQMKVRMCLDARKLNDRTRRDAYPLPHQDRILGRLGASKYLSTIDLSKAFWQIPLDPESRKYTAFRVFGRGLFQFTRLPFGLVNSPASLSRLMDKVLGYGELEPNVFVYLDDIVIASNTFEEHLRSLKDVARRLREANLSINLEKSKFCVPELPYLGFVLSEKGVRPNPDKVESIVNFERPTSVRSLRRFLGMVNYYRRFIDKFSELTAPLTDLLKGKPKIIVWNEAAEQAFTLLKEKLITAPILVCPDFQVPFTIQTDASDTAIAGVLTQEFDGREHVIAYFSRKLTMSQRAWKAAEKEGVAAMEAIEKFRPYVEGTRFTLITDSSALSFIMNTKWKPSSKLSRWSMLLQQYDMVVRHRKGSENVVPDALSRAVEAIEALRDDWYSTTYRKVAENPEKFVDFKIEDKKLYKFVSSPTESMDYRFEWKLCLPKDLRDGVLKQEHDETLHPGFEKTVKKIKLRYYWPKMARETKRYIQGCRVCKQCKPSTLPTAPEMGQQRLANKPFQIMALDFIQSLPRSKTGNCHLLVILDLFSKWTLLVPVKKIESKEVCRIVEDCWFRRFGTPEVVISDNATTFVGKEFKALLDRRGVQHWLNSRHHSQANPVERTNRTVNACLRTYMQQDQRLWDSKISEVEEMINTTIHSSTGMSPYKILYGHEKITKGDEHKRERDEREFTAEERDGVRKSMNEKVFKIVEQNLKNSHEKSRKVYNLRHKKFCPTYQVGQKVYKRNFQLSSAVDRYNAKYGPVYTPCVIVARRGTSSYEVADEAGKSLGVFSAADLRPGEELSVNSEEES